MYIQARIQTGTATIETFEVLCSEKFCDAVREARQYIYELEKKRRKGTYPIRLVEVMTLEEVMRRKRAR
jgi:triphosphoribosyl-dephospho-CoA synthetase